MAAKTKRNARKGHKTRKYIKRRSTFGRIMPPVDVRNEKDIPAALKRIMSGPLTVVLVYADWCGHCKTFKPFYNNAATVPGRSVQAVQIQDEMLNAVNSALNKNMSASEQISVEGYPSLLLLNSKGKKVTDLDTVRDQTTMNNLMKNAGNLATKANSMKAANANSVTGLNTYEENESRATNSVVANSAAANSREIPRPAVNSYIPENINRNSAAAINNSAKGTMNVSRNNSQIANKNATKKLKKSVNLTMGAEEDILSVPSVAVPPEVSTDVISVENATNSLNMNGETMTRSNLTVSNENSSNSYNMSPEPMRGGSLYSALSTSAYTLAPAAVLMGIASMALRKRRRTAKKAVKKAAKKTARKAAKKTRKQRRRL